jgi:RNA polymerase primary sigma factor
MNDEKYNILINKLITENKMTGFITEESLIEVAISNNLPLLMIDKLVEILMSKGIIIVDGTTDNKPARVIDKSRSDYKIVYNLIIESDCQLCDFVNSVEQIDPPQTRECTSLMEQAKNNNTYAKNRIIQMYLRTVLKHTYKYSKRFDIELDECIQDGCEALVVALGKYNENGGGGFSSYFPMWIKQNVTRRSQAFNSNVYIPVHFKDKMYEVYEVARNHYCELCENNVYCPNLQDYIVEKTGCKLEDANRIIGLLKTTESLDHIQETSEFLLNDNGFYEYDMVDEISKRMSAEQMDSILKKLSTKEEEVIRLRFGFTDNKKWTLAEVGDLFDVTRERIRQIEQKALRRLKRLLKNYEGVS